MRILLTGSNGQVGFELCQLTKNSNHEWICLNRTDLDITSEADIKKVLKHHKPDIVINAAAYTAVDKAEVEKELAMTVNAYGPMYLAEACQKLDAALIHISTDYVFSGCNARPYLEDDEVEPKCYYGLSKLKGEQFIVKYCKRHIILRTSWVFGSHGNNFVKKMLQLAREKNTLHVVNDQLGAPTSASGIANALMTIIKCIEDREVNWGTYHYSGFPFTSWYGFAEIIFNNAYEYGLIKNEIKLRAINTVDYPTPAKRPSNSTLDNSKINFEFGIVPDDWTLNIKKLIKHLTKK